MGGKRVKRDSKFQPNKCSKKKRNSCDDDDDDRISQLSDDILVVILSLLSLKEAARTSILSSRWINLWKHTPCLDFDADSVINKIAATAQVKQHELCLTERCKYINWVDRVLQLHKAPTLTHFRICFDLDKSSRISITRWLEFVLSRNVQRLVFELLEYGEYDGWTPDCYVLDLPEEQLLTGFKSLTALSFKRVNVTGKAVESLLRNCPLLEELVIYGTDGIRTLEVCGGPSLVLKHLDLLYLGGWETIKVSAPNLVSLKVDKLKGLLLENVPMLVDLSVICGKDPIMELVPALECCKSQLETLNLEVLGRINENYNFPQLSKLKKLVVTCWGKKNESVIGLSSLIRASPCLEEFVFKLEWSGLSRKDREVKECQFSLPHQHLKVFKFCGYYGRTSDVELVKHVVQNCLVLEKVIIDSNDLKNDLAPLSDEIIIAQQTARKYAKQQLEGELPQRIELVIL